MERVLNQDERIRRAEELYARRKMQFNNRTCATVNVEKKKKRKYRKKLIIQCIICIVLYCCFYVINNVSEIVSKDVIYKISDILEYDINLQELYNMYINKNSEKNVETNENTLIEETLSVTDNSYQDTTVNNEEKIKLQAAEECSSLSQMNVDAEYIKQNYNLIKPLEGEITSRFGIRNPTVATVPKYHTGIDIARVTGTVIIAAMEGTVDYVSSEGDYGNHVIITDGEVSTIYAHCSRIYVTEGQYIKQGQQIAEVGATGNVTGPHLHFEIRRNNQYVDPDLVLQF